MSKLTGPLPLSRARRQAWNAAHSRRAPPGLARLLGQAAAVASQTASVQAVASPCLVPPLLRPLAPVQMPSAPASSSSKWTSSIVGLAQAMVDFTAVVPESFLEQCKVDKGSRRVISLQERHEVIESLDLLGSSSTVSPGGSVANTLVAVARLSAASGGPPVRVSMAGSVGNDALGCYFNAQMKKAGVHMLVDPINPCHTGTCMVLTTPDAQRSFLSFYDSGEMKLTPHLAQAITDAKMLVIEGYMLELPGAKGCLHAIASLARRKGVQVALTAGDPGVVHRHRSTMQSLMSSGLVDVLFSNCEEANALLQGVVPGSGGFGSGAHLSPSAHGPCSPSAGEGRAAAQAKQGVLLQQQQQQQRAGLQAVVAASQLGEAPDSCGCEAGLRGRRADEPHDCSAHGVPALSAAVHEMQLGGSSRGASSERNSSCSSLSSVESSQGAAAAAGFSASEAAAAIAAHVPVVIVTDGARGSCVGVRGQMYQLPPHLVTDPVDVCGAGDAYAAGILFAIMQGHDMRTAAQFAARAAAAVVSRHGAQLAEADAEVLVKHLPNHVLLPQHWPQASTALQARSAAP